MRPRRVLLPQALLGTAAAGKSRPACERFCLPGWEASSKAREKQKEVVEEAVAPSQLCELLQDLCPDVTTVIPCLKSFMNFLFYKIQSRLLVTFTRPVSPVVSKLPSYGVGTGGAADTPGPSATPFFSPW